MARYFKYNADGVHRQTRVDARLLLQLIVPIPLLFVSMCDMRFLVGFTRGIARELVFHHNLRLYATTPVRSDSSSQWPLISAATGSLIIRPRDGMPLPRSLGLVSVRSWVVQSGSKYRPSGAGLS